MNKNLNYIHPVPKYVPHGFVERIAFHLEEPTRNCIVQLVANFYTISYKKYLIESIL